VFSSRPLRNVNVADSILDINWNNIVLVFNWIELTVHERLIQVKHECLPASDAFWLLTQETLMDASANSIQKSKSRILTLCRCVCSGVIATRLVK
jgi:hypothetical protein